MKAYIADNSCKADIYINGLELIVNGFCASHIHSLGPVFLEIRDPSLEMQLMRKAVSNNEKTALLRPLAADLLVSRWHGSIQRSQNRFSLRGGRT